jgi:hypothetical protein
MTLLPQGVKVHLAFGSTDMRIGQAGSGLSAPEGLPDFVCSVVRINSCVPQLVSAHARKLFALM